MPALRCFTVVQCQSGDVIWESGLRPYSCEGFHTRIIGISLYGYMSWHGGGVQVRSTGD